ncbi:Acetyltransferase (GNAT) family protein [Bowdeniella nasicola]|uniref:Acetyltransferase (GNAT) family protein n=1 Tax=Bowdeniella nasicola TaxID=208480 RepID=A0A1H4DY12_9ACTO|nr:GNAT family N-acetyltransferase [Bowdeniella nasicola]SEA77092.1 Acetyltransferase (GNAT) family protein [Bowdeniella nasicola]
MISFHYDSADIRPDMIDGFFVGWPSPPNAQTLIDVMDGSYRRIWAVADGKVVGYINAISDGVLNAFIPWLEVHPDYQEQGIGRELVERMVAELELMYAIDLMCDEELIPYYEKLGFMAATGAVRRNRTALT